MMGDLTVSKMRGASFADRLDASRKASTELTEEAKRLYARGDSSGIVQNKIEQAIELDNHYTILLQEAKNKYRKRQVSRKEFDEERRQLMKKRWGVNDEALRLKERRKMLVEELDEVADSSHQSPAVRLEDLVGPILADTFDAKPGGLALEVDGRTISWRQHLAIKYTGSRRVASFTEVEDLSGGEELVELETWWCPILRTWIEPTKMAAAHIVPRARRNAYVEALFGVPDATEFVMSHRNGLIMHKALENAFAKGYFAIVPASNYDERERPDYKVVVIEYDKLASKGGKRTLAAQWYEGPELKKVFWDDLDGRELAFPPECNIRPARTCLFHHMLTAILHAKLREARGWKKVMRCLLAQRLWASPGAYLNRGLLGAVWTYATDSLLPESLLKHTFIEPNVRSTGSLFLQWRAAAEERELKAGHEEDEDEEMEE